MRVIQEIEFREKILNILKDEKFKSFNCVTGAGRSGAIASVYASHILKIPFIAYGGNIPNHYKILLIDTASHSGKTLRKLKKKYGNNESETLFIYQEPPIVRFWYEVYK